jgi:hypothetical protein
MPHDSLTTAADVLVDKRGFGYSDAYAMLGEIASAPIAQVSNPELLDASTPAGKPIQIDVTDPARLNARAESQAQSAITNRQTGDWDHSPQTVAKTVATNARGRALAEQARADHMAQKTE